MAPAPLLAIAQLVKGIGGGKGYGGKGYKTCQRGVVSGGEKDWKSGAK